jgi:hypothetical protein
MIQNWHETIFYITFIFMWVMVLEDKQNYKNNNTGCRYHLAFTKIIFISIQKPNDVWSFKVNYFSIILESLKLRKRKRGSREKGHESRGLFSTVAKIKFKFACELIFSMKTTFQFWNSLIICNVSVQLVKQFTANRRDLFSRALSKDD